METITRPVTVTQRAAVVTACLFVLAGCHAGNSPGNAGGHEEEHAGHVIPAHKPRTFPAAVRRLRELNDQFLHKGLGEKSESAAGPTSLEIALDIANWLPEIAADSDMPEPLWNEVNVRSERLVADYQGLLTDAAHARTELEPAGAEIGHLEKLVSTCDPSWFHGTGPAPAAP